MLGTSHRSERPSQDASGAGRIAIVAVVAFLLGVVAHSATARGGGHTTEHSSSSTPSPSAPSATGPTRLIAGVPAGFARNEAGAVAASSSFVTTGQVLIDLDPLAAEAAIRQIAATATADEQVRAALDDLRQMRDALRDGSGVITFRQAAIAARVDEFDPARATVAIWSVGVLSRTGVAPPQAGWRVSTFDLVWERDDWHVIRETVTAGPAPVLDDSTVPATAAQLESTLEGFDPLVATPPAWGSER